MCLHTTNTADDIKTPASFEVRCACVCRISDDKLQKGVSHQHFHHMQRIDDREDKKKRTVSLKYSPISHRCLEVWRRCLW